jgi:hypothetical protein
MKKIALMILLLVLALGLVGCPPPPFWYHDSGHGGGHGGHHSRGHYERGR